MPCCMLVSDQCRLFCFFPLTLPSGQLCCVLRISRWMGTQLDMSLLTFLGATRFHRLVLLDASFQMMKYCGHNARQEDLIVICDQGGLQDEGHAAFLCSFTPVCLLRGYPAHFS
ncbi:hypothetical protein DUNSADRAFT_3873 [Dunaliella salina]|uniref:Secreted protein n=1 Tax=Dunaliella salina TaxID=3046 RepID=A0ABQ7GT90_DUNSA|nr:hypothetical protein DUNSADRAFT_3873 [Dunaliella salina]|eukprot:KAF5837801.1 hypothetical protein DUNSADRAFT_3873 [Dunaliella salina]